MPLFTFGYGQACPNRFVRLESREKMVEHFGQQWSMEYPDTPEQEAEMQENAIFFITLDDAIAAFKNWKTKNGRVMFRLEIDQKGLHCDVESYMCILYVNDKHSGKLIMTEDELLGFLGLVVAAPVVAMGRVYEWKNDGNTR